MPEAAEFDPLEDGGADSTENRNPRRRRRDAAPDDVGILIQPEDRHDLDRLVLYDGARREIDAALRAVLNRDQLEAVWRISEIQPQSGRCILNLYGPPGTGKTRAALGIARRLGRPLYQVDYPAVISKYLGDTAKHIALAFRRASEEAAVLFFDEADSLLSRRVATGESCSTSINQNRNALMQELDRFGGVVITTTNLFGNYDPALLRRIARHIKFRLPNAAMREAILRSHIPNLERVDADLRAVAVEARGLSGGDLLNACLNAIHAGSADPDPARWRVTAQLLLDEIARIRSAKADHGNGARRRRNRFPDSISN